MAASLLAAQGLSLRSVTEVLGHAQISTMADLYTHVFEKAQREAAAAMDRALGEKLRPSTTRSARRQPAARPLYVYPGKQAPQSRPQTLDISSVSHRGMYQADLAPIVPGA